jgi:hypothetical protein
MFRTIRSWPFLEVPAKDQPMQVMRSFAVALGVAVLGLTCVERARAQGNVLFPGSTVQGDILRGQGVAYRGAAVLHLNAARARSIDADTAMRFNDYVYRSYQEYLRQRALRIAGKAAGRKATLEEIERRLREAPTDADMAGGDALNVVLVDLADPRIPATVREAAKVPLPEGAARRIPFQYATVGGTLALGRLDVGDVWPVALRYQTLERPRRAYQQAVARLLEQCRSHQLTPEAVEAVGAAARELGSQAEAAIPQSSQAYRQVARQFTGSLERSAGALTRTTYVEDLLGELDGFRGATIGDLVDLMRRYNVHFGPTESPEELGLYQALYPLLVEQRKALGLDAGRSVGRVEARQKSPSSPEVGRQAVAPAAEVAVPRGGADPVIGRWQTDRGTLAVSSVWEFRGDGSLVYERYGKKAFGRWSRQGERIVARTTSDDQRLSIQKWFTIASQGRGNMDVVMEGTRPYTWNRLDLPLGGRP